MHVASIKGQDVLLVYHPGDDEVRIGSQFLLLDANEKGEGILVQILRNESLEYTGLQQELIQQLLEERFEDDKETVLDRERGMDEIRSLKIAEAKIRMKVSKDLDGKLHYLPWDGWIPSRNGRIREVSTADLLEKIVSRSPGREFRLCDIDGLDVPIAGPALDMINVIVGVKGSGKSHFAKLLLDNVSRTGVPCIVFDINQEYTPLAQFLHNCHVYEWGSSYKPSILDVGIEFLMQIQDSVYPLSTENMRAEYEHHVSRYLLERKAFMERQKRVPFVSVEDIMSEFDRLERDGTVHGLVAQGIIRRLRALNNRHLFAAALAEAVDLRTLYHAIAEEGGVIVFDMHRLEPRMQHSLCRSVLRTIEQICDDESKEHEGKPPRKAFPYVFFEEAHQYIEEPGIVNIITRGRHIGITSVFITNTPDKLPEIVFRQLDNLFLLALTHQSDIRHVSKSSLTDESTVMSFATRMPRGHAMLIGKVTNNYPLVVRVKEFPADWPTSGKTRSPWERFAK